MKILYITLENLSLHKGSVVHIKEVIAGFRKLGHHVGLIARASNGFENVEHFYNIYHKAFLPLIFLNLKSFSYFTSSTFLFIYLLKTLSKYDVIYARDYHTAIIALLPRLIFKKKLVLEINGLANEEQKLKGHSVFNKLIALMIKNGEMIAVKCSNRIISVTPQISSYLNHQFGCKKDKVEVVGNGVNTDHFHPINDEAVLTQWRERLGIKREEIVVVFVGNIAPWQGVNILIESAFHLLSKNMELKFLIVGEGLLRTDLIQRVLDSGFEKGFIFTGMMNYEDIPFIINIANICVAPFISKRNRETGVSPLKVYEYMACGKPVIASRIEGVEFLETEKAGRIVEPEDPKDFEEALWDLIKDPKSRINMGQRGLQIASERFSWTLRVTQIEEVLKKMA